MKTNCSNVHINHLGIYKFLIFSLDILRLPLYKWSEKNLHIHCVHIFRCWFCWLLENLHTYWFSSSFFMSGSWCFFTPLGVLLSLTLPNHKIHFFPLTVSFLSCHLLLLSKDRGNGSVGGKRPLCSSSSALFTTSNTNISFGSWVQRDLRLFSTSWILNQAPSFGIAILPQL